MADEPTRGRDVSAPLTEVRTVLSRAENALANLRDYASDPEPDALVSHYGEGYRKSDPDMDEMVAALAEVVSTLSRWRKTGRPRKAKP